MDNSYKEQVTNSFTVSANLKFHFADWLNANAIFSMTNQNTDMEGYWGEKTSYAAQLRGCNYGEDISYPEDSEMPQGGELTKTSVNSQSYTARFQLDANKYFMKMTSITSMLPLVLRLTPINIRAIRPLIVVIIQIEVKHLLAI